jgi:uncharacterized protein YjbI with pentapeptide repeats
MHQLLRVFVLSTLCLPSTTTAKPTPKVAATTSERPWVLEGEFLSDQTLHATRDQTVVLDLEAGGRSSKSNRRNTVRFLVEADRRISFCIPNDEPHISRIKLKRLAGGTILQSRKGDDCAPLRLTAGGYVLEIYHDTRKIPGASRKAFLHRPQKIRLLGSVSDDPLGPASNLQSADFMAFRNGTGQYFTDDTADPQFFIIAQATTVGLHEVWRIHPASASFGVKFSFSNGNGAVMKYFIPSAGNCNIWQLFTGVVSGCGDTGTHGVVARLTDLGGGNFSLYLSDDGSDNGKGNIGAQDDADLRWEASAVFNYDYKGFDEPGDLVLQPGEVALFSQCNYAGPAIVFHADTPDLSIYDGAAPPGGSQLAMGDNMAASLRVGTDTVAILYADSQYGGLTETFGVDVPCLDKTTIGTDTVSSLKIDKLDAYLVSSDGCQRCDLSGFDFSNEDLSGMNFAEAVLSGADLSGTNLQNTNLTSTVFASVETQLLGADFAGAQLLCTIFGEVDLTVATFRNNTIATDQSCYLDLSDATLDYSTFPAEDWQHLDLTDSTVNNVPQVLSTAAAPLDLSGGILSHVTWLAGKTLDGADLGCFPSEQPPVSIEQGMLPGPSGTAPCTASTAPWAIASGEYRLHWQGDGNLVVYGPGAGSTGAVWAAGTNGTGEDLCWQSDGNLVIYSSGNAVWASDTADDQHGGEGGRLLTLSSNGSLQITDASGLAIWQQGPFFGTPVCTTLQGTNLSGASLQSASLNAASLEGADLSFANLAGADLSDAQLLGLPNGNPATLGGAFMPDANLSGADLTGVDANNASFYSASATADASNATMTGARFTNAYLAGADFDGAELESTAWTQAVLIGANFSNAHLEKDTTADEATDFTGAYLQGANFTSSTVTDVDFTTSYWDLEDSSGGLPLVIQLQPGNLEFAGYWNATSAAECVEASYENPSIPPLTTSANFCPDGGPGPCAGVWEMPQTPIDQAVPRSAPYPELPSECTDTDLCWQLGGC